MMLLNVLTKQRNIVKGLYNRKKKWKTKII